MKEEQFYKTYFEKGLKHKNFISLFYREFTPIKGECYDVGNKNWQIAEGAGYASCIILNYGIDKLKQVIENKDISLVKDKLRQDKILNKYFWLGAKIVLKVA